MKNFYIYKMTRDTLLIFKNKTIAIVFAVALFIFSGLFGFFFGLFSIPVPGGILRFYRMDSLTSFEISYMIFSIIVSSLIVAITVYSTKVKIKGDVKGKSTSTAGLATGIFGAICPVCLGVNFLAFGNVFTAQLAFLIPYIFWIQVGGIILLSVGLYFVAKNMYEKKCVSCSVESADEESMKEKVDIVSKKFAAIALIAIVIFAYQITTVFGNSTKINVGSSKNELVTKSGEKISIDDVIELVTPKAGFKTDVEWGDVVTKMIKSGALDTDKLEGVLVERYGQEMKPEWRAVLAGQNAKLSINNDNAVFMMYMLWTLAKHNKNEILTDSPFAKSFKNWDIGVGRTGYGDTSLLALTSGQQAIAERVSQNAYRPCCSNSTAAPDCSHGYSALGLVQLMASQGFSEEEIFETFIQFNSFWFPETYIKNALYFKLTEGKDWGEVSKKLVAGKEYSTAGGSFTAKNYLKDNFGI